MNWIVWALLSGSGAAMLAVVIKLHLKHINPLFVFLLFSLVTILLLLTVDAVTHKVDCKIATVLTMKDWIALLVAGALNTFAFICYLNALKCGPAGGVLALDRLGIVFALILASLFLQETFTLKAVIGSVLMVAGAFLIGS